MMLAGIRSMGCWFSPVPSRLTEPEYLPEDLPTPAALSWSVLCNGRGGDVPRIGPAMDCETVSNAGRLWGEKSLLRGAIGFVPAGQRPPGIKLIIRRSEVRVLPAPREDPLSKASQAR
jgi:hypothetical protein